MSKMLSKMLCFQKMLIPVRSRYLEAANHFLTHFFLKQARLASVGM